MASRYFRLGAFMYILYIICVHVSVFFRMWMTFITHSPAKYFIDIHAVCVYCRRFVPQLRSVLVCAKCSLFIFNIIKLLTFHLDKMSAVWL